MSEVKKAPVGKDGKPNPNINDVIYETDTAKIEYDRASWGQARWQVFSRLSTHALWKHVAEAMSAAEAHEIVKDPARMEGGDLFRTEIERRVAEKK